MTTERFQDLHHSPYWLDGLPSAPETSRRLPERADVVIVGAGYTGLSAAIELARGGRSTLIVEAGAPGHGCSTRNGGQVAAGIKPSLAALTRTYGAERATAIRAIGSDALAWTGERITQEGIDCDYTRSGFFYAAHTPQHYESLAREAETLRKDEGEECHIVPRADQRRELGTDAYFGGAVFPDNAGLHPAKYLRGLLDVALQAGVTVVGDCAATGITRTADGAEVTTAKGTVRARDVIVATNGYTNGLTSWLQRRVVPIATNIIATEPLPKALVDTLFPTGRMVSDTRKVIYYYRTSPDRTRILFGGRVAARETGAAESAVRLYDVMCDIFPDLRAYGVTHSWGGTVAFSFDEMPHTGTHDGVHYAMGYCGSGVALSSYLGMRTGQRVLGLAEGRTVLDGLTYPTRPLYYGKPWFLPAAVAWYRWRDDIALRKARAGG